jgi:hypothetical protein
MAMVMALAFVSVVGMLSLALLGQLATGARFTTETQTIQRRVLAVDGGVQTGIQLLQKAPLCGDATTPITLASGLDIGGVTVDITCKLPMGVNTPQNASAWAIFLTGQVPGGRVQTSNCASCSKQVTGAVYNGTGGWDLQSGLSVQGDVIQPGIPCPGSIAGLSTGPVPFRFRCIAEPALPLPEPTQPLPALASLVSVTPPANPPGGQCKVYSPGRYDGPSAPPAFSNGANYLKSGVYVLNNVGTISVPNNAVVIGGRGVGSMAIPASCVAARDADAVNGVMLILAGNSRIELSPGARVEIHGWKALGSTNPIGVSIRQLLTTDPADWRAAFLVSNATTIASAILKDGNGSSGALAIRGSIYVPNGSVVLASTNQSFAKVSAGAVVGNISVSASASSPSGPFVSSGSGGGSVFNYVVTATSHSPDAKTISTTAEVAIDAGTGVTRLVSWAVVNS